MQKPKTLLNSLNRVRATFLDASIKFYNKKDKNKNLLKILSAGAASPS